MCCHSGILARLTFFHSAATCLHVPARLTRESTKHEGRKPRASERHVVGCCEELGRVLSLVILCRPWRIQRWSRYREGHQVRNAMMTYMAMKILGITLATNS